MTDFNFKRAKEIPIFDDQGRRWLGQKGLVNEANEEERFSIVGEGYKVIQHDEVAEVIEKALEDLKLDHTITPKLINEGIRVSLDLHFPTIQQSIAGENLKMWASFDNSYNCTTGLRLEVNAFLPETNDYVYSAVVSETLNRYYHKHTKGLSIDVFEGTLNKGIELFQTKIKEEFESLANTAITAMQAREFIKELVEKKEIKTETSKEFVNNILDDDDLR